jgi:hypothetical protein
VWQREDHGRGHDTCDCYDRESCAHGISRVPGYGSSKSKRRQGGAVDQAEHDEREAEHAHAGRTGSVATDDSDSHRVVEAAGKRNADQGGAAVGGRERERLGPLLLCEELSPPVRLEPLRKDEKQSRRDQRSRMSGRKRPGRGREMTSRQQHQDNHNGTRPRSERPLDPARTMQSHHCFVEQAIPTIENDRCGRNVDA